MKWIVLAAILVVTPAYAAPVSYSCTTDEGGGEPEISVYITIDLDHKVVELHRMGGPVDNEARLLNTKKGSLLRVWFDEPDRNVDVHEDGYYFASYNPSIGKIDPLQLTFPKSWVSPDWSDKSLTADCTLDTPS
jgi:hypothetical protein